MKTRREAIKNLKYLISNKYWEPPMDYIEEIEMAITDMKICEANNAGWISVKDRLPESKTNPVTLDFNEVICFCDFGGDPKRTDVRTYKFGTRLGDTRPHFWNGLIIMDGVVTHWQYLPEPPKEET